MWSRNRTLALVFAIPFLPIACTMIYTSAVAVSRSGEWLALFHPLYPEMILSTQFAEGYSDARFRQIRVGMTSAEVDGLLPEGPIDVVILRRERPHEVREASFAWRRGKWTYPMVDQDVNEVFFRYTRREVEGGFGIVRGVVFDPNGVVTSIIRRNSSSY